MSGRKWSRLPPAGMGVFVSDWAPSWPHGDDMAAKSEKVFVFHPTRNRWCCVGFLSDGSPDTTLLLQIGKSRTEMTRNQFEEVLGAPASNASFARTIAALVVPDGSTHRLVVSAGRATTGTQNVVTLSDFGGLSATWTTRTGPYGSVTHAMTSMVWTGSAIVGGSGSDTRVGRSSNLGSSWSSPYDWTATINKVVTDGNGTVLAFSSSANYIRSTDHGATWSTATMPDWVALTSFHDAVWALGKFIVLNDAGDSWMSSDGLNWQVKSREIKDPVMVTSTPQGRAYRSMVACGNLLVAPWGLDGGGSTYTTWGLLYSAEGYTWHNSGVLGLDYAPLTSYTRELHVASSTPEHRAAPYTPIHSLVYYPGDVTVAGQVTRGLFSPMEWRGIAGLDESIVGMG